MNNQVNPGEIQLQGAVNSKHEDQPHNIETDETAIHKYALLIYLFELFIKFVKLKLFSIFSIVYH